MDDDTKRLCDTVCSPTLDGYTPNPLFNSTFCPDYMQAECNADGGMFERQWEAHQSNIRDFTARRMLSRSFQQRPQEFAYTVVPQQQQQQQQQQQPVPPTMAQVYRSMVSVIPTRPAVNTLAPTNKRKKKRPQKRTSKRRKK